MHACSTSLSEVHSQGGRGAGWACACGLPEELQGGVPVKVQALREGVRVVRVLLHDREAVQRGCRCSRLAARPQQQGCRQERPQNLRPMRPTLVGTYPAPSHASLASHPGIYA